jgi:hypothetical protein
MVSDIRQSLNPVYSLSGGDILLFKLGIKYRDVLSKGKNERYEKYFCSACLHWNMFGSN